jgi:AGCS family alanine or glycine:cation symporter
MQSIFEAINGVFSFIGPLSDFLWDFPTNFEWYRNIPLLGNFSLAIILLLGSGIFFSFKLGFMQVTHFKKGVRILTERRSVETGISPLAAFLLSSAMRVGPGNIIGVTGAIAVGGPGALFWMWISAFFGMAVAYMEGVLAQIFKERKGDELVGGLPFYGRKLLGNKVWVGVFLSVLYILYALCCLPAQGFNVVSSIGRMAEIVTGTTIATDSLFYYIVGALIIILTAVIAFGGIKKVTKWTDMMVPVMAVLYIVVVLILIVLNIGRIPYFFTAVFGGAFKSEAFFGGAFGTVLAQGVKRGLMSNEAGQGTITMSAAASDAKHPCEQGLLASIGVFLDTIVICTLTGFVVVMAHCWTGADAQAWAALDKLPKFTESIAVLTPGTAFNSIMTFLVTLCFCLFAFTCLLGMISFSEIAANRIRKDAVCINIVRCIALFVAAFGILCNIAGLELGNLWAFSDLGNILIVYFNVPIVYVGAKYVFRATRHYKKNDGTPFTSAVIGRDDCTFWDEKEKNRRKRRR